MSKEKSKNKEIKPCLTCKPVDMKGIESPFQMENEEAPEWSKKEGNYSPYPKMITCDEKYNLKHRESLVEEDPEIEEKSISVKLSLGKKYSECWVFCWGAISSNDMLNIKGAAEAYDSERNHCFKKVDKKGDIECILNCPQPYKVDGKTYCRHIHYLAENKSKKIWDPMKTIRIICDISIEELDIFLKEKNALVIDSLPQDIYMKEHIPKTLNFPRELLDKLDTKNKTEKIEEFIDKYLEDYPKLNKIINNKTLDKKDIPFIIYCFDKNCKSSGRFIDHLYECGYNNIYEYSGGIKEWFNGKNV